MRREMRRQRGSVIQAQDKPGELPASIWGKHGKGVQEGFVEQVASVAGELEYELTGQKPFQVDKMDEAMPWWQENLSPVWGSAACVMA